MLLPRLIIKFSDHSQSTSDRTPSDHSDDEFGGAPVDSASASSQVDWSDQSGGDHEDEFVHVRHVRVRRTTSYGGRDDIEPADSASRPATSRTSSQHRRAPGDPERAASRRRTAVPDPPPAPHQPRPARGGSQRVPRESARGRPPRPQSFHSDSLEQDDYPYGGPALPFRGGAAPGWGHVPPHAYPQEPTVLSDTYPARDVMSYRDPYRDPYMDDNPFARAPIDEFGYPSRPAPQRRPHPQHRYSMGPMSGPPPGAMMRYHSQPYYDPYMGGYYQPMMPPHMGFREPSPEKEAPKVATPPAPAISPSDERFHKLEMMILAQTKMEQERQLAKRALKEEEERKKEEKDKLTQTEKLIALETLIKKQEEAAKAREKAMELKAKEAEMSAIAKMQREAAEKAATEKIGKELSEAAAKAKKAAEDEADAKAKKAKEEADKALAEMKKKHEEAEAAKKKAEEEAAALKPKGVPPPIKFKDAVNRKFSFPYDICKTWKVSTHVSFTLSKLAASMLNANLLLQGMESLIRQAFMHVDVLGPHVMEGHYDLIGPDGEIILPQVWDTMIKPDYSIEMQMWPLPELEKQKAKTPADLDRLLMGVKANAAGKAAGKVKAGHKIKGSKGATILIPPAPTMAPGPGVIPPPPGGGIPAMPIGIDIDALIESSGAMVGDSGGKSSKKKSSKDVGGMARWIMGPGPKKKR